MINFVLKSISRDYPRLSALILLSSAVVIMTSWDVLADNEVGSASKQPAGPKADVKHYGGETEGIVQVASLFYGGSKSSQCFSDHFLLRAEHETSISTNRRFHAVKLSSDEVFDFPLVVMTGEGTFSLLEKERETLKRYIERGGLLLASAGCSSSEWDRSFRSEMARLFPDRPLTEIPKNHPVFHTVHDIDHIDSSHGGSKPLQGITIGDGLGVIYSVDGLNDTSHAQGCCCCGGSEIKNAEIINVNILAYALMY